MPGEKLTLDGPTLAVLVNRGALWIAVCVSACEAPTPRQADWPCDGDGSEIRLPWRVDGLPAGSFMRTSGHGKIYDCPNGRGGGCANDITGVRWDEEAGDYTSSRTRYGAPVGRSDSVAWELPLYAPFDGLVIGCWRRMPDDEEDFSEPPECPLDAPCINGGNHLLILTADDHLLTLNHLRQDSIPAHLCPIDEVIARDSEPKAACGIPGMRSAMRDIARLELRGIAPIRVAAGEYIGRVGVSGQAGGVHVHMGIAEFALDADGTPCDRGVEMNFVDTLAQPRRHDVAPVEDRWIDLAGACLRFDGTDYLLWPDAVAPDTAQAR